MTTASAPVSSLTDPATSAPQRRPGTRVRPARVAAHIFLTIMAVSTLFPILWALYNSFRDYAYTTANGYISFGGFTFGNYVEAWERGEFGLHFANSLLITVPAVLLTLFLASCTAFILARFDYRFNIALLGVFLAANLLPPQALLIPIFRLYNVVPLPLFLSDTGEVLGSFWGLILINVAFQLGFCTFVLSNYMKALPRELYEAAEVDGASVARQFWQITLPLCRPALAALAVLETTFIYNEFFWATVLLQDNSKFPITSSLNQLRGQFFVDYNLLSAGSVLVALPVLVVFFALQKHFVAGLTLGSTKG